MGPKWKRRDLWPWENARNQLLNYNKKKGHGDPTRKPVSKNELRNHENSLSRSFSTILLWLWFSVTQSFSLFVRCLLTQTNCLQVSHKKFWNAKELVNTQSHNYKESKYMPQFSQNSIVDPEAGTKATIFIGPKASANRWHSYLFLSHT